MLYGKNFVADLESVVYMMRYFNSAVKDAINSMIDDVCRKYGFEVYETISFCQLIDNGASFNTIKKAYDKLMK